MGQLVRGRWVEDNFDTRATGGRFVRAQTQFRAQLTTGAGPHPVAAGRYHLYVAAACPWAHRTLIMRALKGLQDLVSVSFVLPKMGRDGWELDPAQPGPVDGARLLREIYLKARPDCTGRVTVPVLWDKEAETIVNNESAEIIRMLNHAFDELGATPGDYYPDALRAEIDELNERIYDTVNNGVYKAGFASTQQAHSDAVGALFESLDWLEQRLRGEDYLVGGRLTEADIRLFPTLVRFDLVYHTHFKCNVKRVLDLPNLRRYRRRIYGLPGVADTVRAAAIKEHYYRSHTLLNPFGIVPEGPAEWL